MCVRCVVRSAPPSQFVVSARIISVTNVLMPTLVGNYTIHDGYRLLLNLAISTYTTCFVGKVCGPLWSTWGAPLGEDKCGVKAGVVNTKVARRANPPP